MEIDAVTDLPGPVAAPPPRRPGSVRRTSTILMSWPDGILNGLQLAGRCRDLLTSAGGEALVLAQEDMLARASLARTIQAISSSPSVPGLESLVGSRAGNALRGDLDRVVPDLRNDGAPLYLLLDDLAGASLIAGFVWFRWRDHLPELEDLRKHRPPRKMEGICSGFRPGASSLNPDGTQSFIPHRVAVVPPLVDAGDPDGWHAQDDPPPMAMRRARRIDVWHHAKGDGTLRVDAMFRDSCWEPDGIEIAVHEYHLTAAAEPDGARITSVVAEPRVLPFVECPAAAANVGVMEGVPLADLREETLGRLQGTDCCTHLNDALRALAEVPVLAHALARAES